MFSLKQYTAAESLDQAFWLLQQDKSNVILGGLLWMKMGKKQYHTGIDLKNLGLDHITETGDTVEIGAMTSLRQMETSRILSKWFGPLFSRGLGSIVGIQFRNLATLGGSVYSRFGFSDVITALMALDTRVHLHQTGTIPLETFLSMPLKKDIISGVGIKKQSTATSYQSIRKSATDFPVLSLGAALTRNGWKISVGARPGRACPAPETAALLPDSPDKHHIHLACETIANEVTFGTDQRGGKAYRSAVVKILLKRGIERICR